jgi:methanogenic corrinoid protein MtbC1
MPDHAVLDLLALLERRDREEAVGEVVRLYERSGSLEPVLSLLAGAQREVGRRWAANEWSVAQEHAATAIVDMALAVVAGKVATPATRDEIVVTCAEGEWHVLPARLLAEHLRLEGFGVSFLGASTPAEHLQRFLAKLAPAALCVSCSVPIFLLGAARSIEAGRASGVPVLAGGAAFGPDGRRAAVLGADAWAPDGPSAVELLAGGITVQAHAGPPGGREEALALAAERPDLVDDAMERLRSRYPPLDRYTPWQMERTKEDLAYILQFIEAAVLTGDERIIDEFVPWLLTVLVTRGVPAKVVTLSLEILAEAVRDTSLPGGPLIDRAAAQARR